MDELSRPHNNLHSNEYKEICYVEAELGNGTMNGIEVSSDVQAIICKSGGK